MSLEVSGKLIELRPIQEGTSAKGPWKKQDMIIETNEQYPKKICITCWNDRVTEAQAVQPGTTLKISINIESREYMDKWYTDVRAWKIESDSQGFSQAPPPSNEGVETSSSTSFSDSDGEVDDLPF